MLANIRREIKDHPSNAWAKKLDYRPVYQASKTAKIVIIGQASGIKAQESKTPWNDVSGDKLREWLDLTKEEFYDATKIALIPMDFYYPGKGKNGDLPPRKDFATKWHPRLYRHMPDIELKILAGAYAQKHYLHKNMKQNLTETVRSYKEYLPEFFPIVHPSPLNIRWRNKNQWFEKKIVPELKEVVHNTLI